MNNNLFGMKTNQSLDGIFFSLANWTIKNMFELWEEKKSVGETFRW